MAIAKQEKNVLLLMNWPADASREIRNGDLLLIILASTKCFVNKLTNFAKLLNWPRE